MRLAAALVALLSACAAPMDLPSRSGLEERRIVWIRSDSATSNVCGTSAYGCYRMKNGACVIYTRSPRGIYDESLHNTAGHELRHCFEGDFHGTERRVVNMNTWRQSNGVSQ